MNKSIEQAASVIKEADAVLICAGAGMGVDSGLPDFRGNEGFWNAYPPFAKLGYSFIDMANPGWFHRDPHLAWGFYGHRLNLYRNTTPHHGFETIKQWAEKKKGGVFVFTSNVDGQFQQAGFGDESILECHGSIHHMQCVDPNCSAYIWDGHQVTITVDEKTMKAQSPLPQCRKCESLARPNILMFGDWNWLSDRTELQQQGFQRWLEINNRNKIAIIECGAGTAVPTVRMTSERIVGRYKATLIRINTREPQVPSGQIGIPLGALEALGTIGNQFH